LRKNYQGAGGQIPSAEILSTEQGLQAARLTLAETRQALWLAVADLQSLMHMDIEPEFGDGLQDGALLDGPRGSANRR
jgi:hypothetical protein